MVGYGSMDHLDLLVQQNASEYQTALLYEDGQYKTSDNVYVRYCLFNSSGKLTVSRDSGFAAPGMFGPELMFGFTIGDARKDGGPVLLIKTAWGGKSLAVDFRPPSSGKGSYDNVKPIEYGYYYRQMIQEVLDTLDNIEKYVPRVNAYDISGFVWFQGWNDMLNYPMVYEYGGNLVNFIHDVRSDLDAPHLPFGKDLSLTFFAARLTKQISLFPSISNWRARYARRQLYWTGSVTRVRYTECSASGNVTSRIPGKHTLHTNGIVRCFERNNL